MQSMFKPKPKKDIFNLSEKTIDEFAESNIEVEVSDINGTVKKTIAELVREAKEKNKAVIFTFTPGPFKTNEELPENWMNTDKAKGCTNQLTILNQAAEELDAIVYAVNKQTSEYQSGPDGLIEKKNLKKNIRMISDSKGKLQEAFNLPTIELPDSRYPNSNYFERFSIIYRPDGLRNILKPESPLDVTGAQAHVEALKDFRNLKRLGWGGKI